MVMAARNVMVLVDTKHGNSFESVQDAVEKGGLRVDKVMRGLRTITGELDENLIERLRGIDGVAAVREEGTFSLPPMDSKTPQ
jgi:hypothetical protein